MEQEQLSVIIPTYNHAKYISDCIESVINQQTEYKIKIYIMDDSSTDGSTEIIESYKLKYPEKIELFLSPKNLGSGKALHYFHNPQIKGDYWTILEGDDHWVSKDKVQKQLSALEIDHTLVGSGHCVEIFDVKNQLLKVDCPTIGTYSLYQQIKNQNTIYHYSHTSTLIWRHIFKGSGHYLPKEFKSEQICGDPLLFALMTKSGGLVKYIPDLLSRYNYTGTGLHSKLSAKEQTIRNEIQSKRIFQLLPKKHQFNIKHADTLACLSPKYLAYKVYHSLRKII